MNDNLQELLDKIPELFSKNQLLLILFLYLCSGVYYFIYYSFFDIDIFNYISINDLIFYGLKQALIILVFSFLLYKLTNFISKTTIKISFKIYHFLPFKKITEIEEFKPYFEIILSGIIGLPIFYIFSDFTALIFLNILLILFKNINKNNPSNKIKPITFIITILSFAFIYFLILSISLPTKKLNSKDNTHISFYSEGTYYSTKNTNLNYNGETSQYIFLYDYKNNVSLIFFKENIKDFKKYNNSHVIQIRNFFK